MKRCFIIPLVLLAACNNKPSSPPVHLITLDPGHFHAALVQKSMYDDVDSTVYVYSPGGSDLQQHLDRISNYNHRAENPTHWNEVVYTGPDFFEKMIAEKKGNAVVLSGNNQKKTDYIFSCLENGMNVLADKPMVIDGAGFEKLKQAFETAGKKHLLLYDIMTERFEINTILQRELSMMPEIFGTLEKGTSENPAISLESVHYLYKYVSGNVLTRPTWFLDVSQQGEGITDVMTHLADLVQWECFPGKIIDYKKDITVNSAERSPTPLTLSQFKEITKTDSFPSFLKPVVKDSILYAYFNGVINYTINGVCARTSARWDYKAPEGSGDTHYSLMRGTKCNLLIKQGKEENYQTVLYILPADSSAAYKADVTEAFKKVSAKFPGVSLSGISTGWKVEVPAKLREGHEAHFARVTENFLDYLKNNSLPGWEIPNMLAKYYTTTKGLEMAVKKQR